MTILSYYHIYRNPSLYCLKGFVYPHCENAGGWLVADGRYKCTSCKARISVTAGTLFDRRRTPLTVWFTACWMFAYQKDGISALSLQRALDIGSYQTAWVMLHRLRSVLVRPERERLSGIVEVDETYLDGEEHGLRGGRSKGKKLLVGVAVERLDPKGFGRCRMAIIPDGSAESPHPFVVAHVEPGTTVITDTWQGYSGIDKLGYVHEPHSQRGASASWEDIAALLPGVHRVASLAKRLQLGTHQGRVDGAHLQSYLDEFTFRFNQRRSRSRGLLFYRLIELAVAHDPVRYRQLVANPRANAVPPTSPTSEDIPRAWTDHGPPGHGECRKQEWSGQMNIPKWPYEKQWVNTLNALYLLPLKT